MSWDSIVVLQHGTALATKRFWLGLTGEQRVDPYGNGKYFVAETVPLEGLDDLAGLLAILAKDPRAFVVRGEVIPGSPLERLRRAKKADGDEPPMLREYPRRWVMIDVDGGRLSARPDWSTPEGCAAAADACLGLLPRELRVAGHVWQCSSSAGLKPGYRMHFWFALDRALGEDELTRWGSFVNDTAGYKLIDLAVFRTVQPLYVAEPVFDHVLNPVAQRMGYVPGASASLPKVSGKGDAWKRKLEPLYYESNNEIHTHVRDACASFFCANGPDADATSLQKELFAAVARARELQERPNDYPEAQLQAEISSGREFSRTRVEAGENLLLDGRGEPRGSIANLLSVMQAHDDWRGLLGWNTRAAHIQILRPTPWGGPAGEWLDARDSVRATSWFAKEKRMSVDDGTLLRAAITFAREREIDPVVEWLLGLEWDGHHRMDNWMIGWCGAESSEYIRAVSRMFLIGCVARALTPGCKHDSALVLQGDTGNRKSTLLEVLGGTWYASVTEEKDILQKIHGPWIVELPELGPFRAMHYNKIKGFMSTRIDRFRAPYMRLPEDRPRTCVIAATLNPEGIGWQEDATSARRYHPVDVGVIDTDAIGEAREQLFAEAVLAFRAGEPWWVHDPKDTRFTEAQGRAYATDIWETIFRRTLATGGSQFTNGKPTILAPNAPSFELGDLLAVSLSDMRGARHDQARAAKALIRLGYVNEGTVWSRKVLTPDRKSDRE